MASIDSAALFKITKANDCPYFSYLLNMYRWFVIYLAKFVSSNSSNNFLLLINRYIFYFILIIIKIQLWVYLVSLRKPTNNSNNNPNKNPPHPPISTITENLPYHRISPKLSWISKCKWNLSNRVISMLLPNSINFIEWLLSTTPLLIIKRHSIFIGNLLRFWLTLTPSMLLSRKKCRSKLRILSLASTHRT